MNKLLFIIVCTIAGIGTMYAQSNVTPPEINPCYGKEFFRKQQVKFSCATKGAQIFYTVDGTVPAASSTEYSEEAPLYIDETVTIKAIAVNGESTSEVSELTCEKNQRVFLIVGEYGGKKYYMSKDAVDENVNTFRPLAAKEYTGETLLTPKKIENMAWFQLSDGKIVSKSKDTDKYLAYKISYNSTYLDNTETQARKWEITVNEMTSDTGRKICINKNGYFLVLEPSPSNATIPKAYPVNVTKGAARTGLTVGNFGTLSLPYDIVVSDTKGATFYNIKGKKEDNSKTTLYLEEENGILKAGYPYIYKVNSNSIYLYYLDEIEYAKGLAECYSHNGLTGVYKSTTVPKGMYIINGTKVVKCGNNCNIDSGYAYIDMDKVPTLSDTEAKKTITISTDGSTSITNVESEDGSASQHYYNLNGQRVMNPSKGLYIHNGKKIIIK